MIWLRLRDVVLIGVGGLAAFTLSQGVKRMCLVNPAVVDSLLAATGVGVYMMRREMLPFAAGWFGLSIARLTMTVWNSEPMAGIGSEEYVAGCGWNRS